jgi:monothiol glutaredoxin
MVRKSGQPLSPCVEIDGVMLADVSGEEVENYLLSNDLVKATEVPAGAPTNAGCSDEEHAKMATKTIRFF